MRPLENGGAKRRRKDNSKWRARGQIKVYFLIVFRASLVAQMVKHLPAMRRPGFNPWIGKSPWRRKWQPTPIFFPGKSHGQRTLIGYSLWGCKESDMTE